ncbi:origin of replication complex subunit 5-like [Coffea arabica]|uniref:Origin of replication complex subunit 5-like n=1 Tax=Coffea arabica TaxID=13443 RepID=A0A6P6VZ15_COFAR|nr:origin of replication complex subunit 5-like [Coffea arabica]
MSSEESPQITRRTTRLSAANSENAVDSSKSCALKPLSVNDLLYGNSPISLEELISSFPGRRGQIIELMSLLGPVNSPMFPTFVYGGSSTGKTSIVLNIFRHLRRPFVYASCITCYSPRILFESILNQLMLHRKSDSNGYSSIKRCDKPSDFVNLLREALSGVIGTLQGNAEKAGSKKAARWPNGKMVYLIFDSLNLVKEWEKSSTILPFLFNLYDILRMPEVGLIFISNNSLDTYYADTGFVEPFPFHFPDYSEDDLRQILLKHQVNKNLYSSFLDVVLRPFCRITRRVNELSTALLPLFKKYCEPLGDLGAVPNEDMKRKLYGHLQRHIAPSLNETFRVSAGLTSGASRSKDNERKGIVKKLEACTSSNELDFHMSTSAKFLLISAFLASRNPATLDASFFDSTGGSDNRKRKRKSSAKSLEQKETAEQELLMKGPGTFPLERLLAIFQCLTSVAEYSPDVEGQGNRATMGDSGYIGSHVLLQLSSLCNANFITKGGSCPLEGSTRYRSNVSEDMVLKVARSVKFPLSKYLYRR